MGRPRSPRAALRPALLPLGVAVGGALLLGHLGRIGSGDFPLSVGAWSLATLGLWLLGRAHLAALDRWDGSGETSLRRAFEARGTFSQLGVEWTGRLLQLALLGAALWLLATLLGELDLLVYKLTIWTVGFVPLALYGLWRWKAVLAYEGERAEPTVGEAGEREPWEGALSDVSAASPYPRGWVFEALVTGLTVLLTPFVGAAVAAGGLRGRAVPPSALAAMVVAGFLVTLTAVRGLLRQPELSDVERWLLYLSLAWFSAGAFLMLRRRVLARP